MFPIELFMKSLFLCFLGLKLLLQVIALTLLVEWSRLTNSGFHKALLLFLLLVTSAEFYRSYVDSALQILIDTRYLVAQAVETAGWAVFIYALYKSE